jgi:hypothetical protein
VYVQLGQTAEDLFISDQENQSAKLIPNPKCDLKRI